MAYLSLLKNPAWDIVLIFTLVAAGFFWGISGGKKKMALSMLALYALLAIFPYLPVDAILGGRAPNEIFVFRAGIFLALLLLLSLFLSRAFSGSARPLADGNGAWWEIILLSILAAGFLAASILSLAPAEVFKNNTLNLSSLTLKLFADQAYSKWWTIIPIFGVLFL